MACHLHQRRHQPAVADRSWTFRLGGKRKIKKREAKQYAAVGPVHVGAFRAFALFDAFALTKAELISIKVSRFIFSPTG